MKGGLGIIARLGSTRLPDKHLNTINNIPVTQYLIDRIVSHFNNEIIKGGLEVSLLTGAKSSNQKLADVFFDNGLKVFFGSDNNIPLRIFQAMQEFNWDYIISIDGDDIFCSTDGMKQVHTLLMSGTSYVITKGLPFGMNSMGLNRSFVKNAIKRVNHSNLETGWGWVFDKDTVEEVNYSYDFPKYLRFTLDYCEDLEFFKAIIQKEIDWKSISDKKLINLVLDNKLYLYNKDLMDEYWNNFYNEQNFEKGKQNG
ncbi:MAG: hypothetical protein HOF35_14300 [Bacteroidetes bacterium]|jgi:spore coat polysaccharide biosynthesis protein SpsF|nr:hypothetical protein [Bacteroidota bacterium]MBT4968445.1 hypothetical protein [Bacteroidota bacterium]